MVVVKKVLGRRYDLRSRCICLFQPCRLGVLSIPNADAKMLGFSHFGVIFHP